MLGPLHAQTISRLAMIRPGFISHDRSGFVLQHLCADSIRQQTVVAEAVTGALHSYAI